MLHPIAKSLYKIKLSKKWRFHNVFHISQLDKKIIKKKQIDKIRSWIEFENDGDSKEYKIKVICNSKIYASKSEGYLLGLYYLFLGKSYLKEENT